MKKTDLLKQLENLTKRSKENPWPVSKSSKTYQFVKQIIEGAKSIRPVYTSGSGRYTSNQNHTVSTISLLEKLGIEYTLSNDAPRGGAVGDLIEVKTEIEI